MKIHPLGALLVAILALCFASPRAALAQSAATNVLVIGGTPAGVAAAVAAARHGSHVELVARGPRLGGVLTDAMMDQWDMNLASDGAQIQGGIFSEIYGKLGDSFTPAQAAATFADLVADEPRIHLITSAVPIAAETERIDGSQSVSAVTFRANNDRTFTIEARSVIDASDDGDVAALAGARFDLGRQDTGRDELMQPVTLMFTVTGVDWSQVEESYSTSRDGFGAATERRAWGYAKLLRDYQPHESQVIVADLNLGHEDGGNVTVNAIDVLDVDGRSDVQLARARAASEREAPQLIAWLRSRIPGFEQAQIGKYADNLYVRETRHFAGEERLTADDVWDGSVPTDTIGLSSYPLDLHPVTLDAKPAFAPVRHIYGIPFGSLVPMGFSNLILASPAISASHLASGSARVIPTTIEEGEAAGTAAALAIAYHIDFSTMSRSRFDFALLRTQLERDGSLLTQAQVSRI